MAKENQTGYAEYLEHYGVKGMRWGIRRTPEQLGNKIKAGIKRRQESARARQEQMKRISNRSILDTKYKTLQLAKYGSNNLVKRYGTSLAGAVVTKGLIEVLSGGDFNRYLKMSKKDLAKEAVKLMGSAAVTTAINDYKVRNISKRYDEKGRSISDKNYDLKTPEDKIDAGVKALKCGAYVASFMSLNKISQMKKENDRNREIFERWGKNILESSYDDVIYQSPGGEYYVYNAKKR